MKTIYRDGVLLIRPEGRIDSDNAQSVEKEIFSYVDSNSPKYVVIDAEKLDYISSAGLRVLLKLKKKVKNTQVVNVSVEVYEVFDMTGFAEILNVRKTIRRISVEGCKVLGEGGRGITYKLNNDTIVKIYKSSVPYEDMVREKENAKAAIICGIPTAIPFDTVRCGDQYGTVYELIDSRTLGEVISANPGKIDEYARKAADLLILLGTTEDDMGKFSSFSAMSHENADTINHALEGDLFTAEEIAAIHKLFDTIPERDTLIHGDFHTHNIYEQDGELLLIDMADMSKGHPIYEFGHMYLAFHYLLIQGGARVKRLIGLDAKTAESFFRKVIDFYFADLEKEEVSEIMHVANIIGHLRMMFCSLPTMETLPAEKKRQCLLGFKNQLRELYFDKEHEVLDIVKKVTALF